MICTKCKNYIEKEEMVWNNMSNKNEEIKELWCFKFKIKIIGDIINCNSFEEANQK